jgi:hypothetical protein
MTSSGHAVHIIPKGNEAIQAIEDSQFGISITINLEN